MHKVIVEIPEQDMQRITERFKKEFGITVTSPATAVSFALHDHVCFQSAVKCTDVN